MPKINKDQTSDMSKLCQDRNTLHLLRCSGFVMGRVCVVRLQIRPRSFGTLYSWLRSPNFITLYKQTMSQDQREEKLRRGRNILTLAEKVDVLRQLETGISHRKIADLFGVGRTQIGNISKRKKEILDLVEDYGRIIPKHRKRVRIGSSKNFDVNELCYAWYKKAASSGISVTGSLLKKKALEIAKAANNETFKASNGWLDSFRTRHNISFSKSPRSNRFEIPDTSSLQKKSEDTSPLPTKSIGNTMLTNNSEQLELLENSGMEMFLFQQGEETMSDEVENEDITLNLECQTEGCGDSSEMFLKIKQEVDNDNYRTNQETDDISQSSLSDPLVTSYPVIFSGEVNHEGLNKGDNCSQSSDGRHNFKWRTNCLNKLKGVLQNTISELENFGAEIAAWLVIPYDDKNCLMTHMGSKHGEDFIKTKPDIDAELNMFLKKRKGYGRDYVMIKENESGLPQRLHHSQQSDTPLTEQDTDTMDPQQSYLSVTQQRKQRKMKRKIDDLFVYDSPSSSDDAVSCGSREDIEHQLGDRCIDQKDTMEDRKTKDDLVDRCLKMISEKYASSTDKDGVEFPYKLLIERGKPWFKLSGFPEDLLPFRHPSEYDVDSLRRILDHQDKIIFNILHRKLSKAYLHKEPCNSNTKKLLQNRLFKETSIKHTDDFSQVMDIFTEKLEMSVSQLNDLKQKQNYVQNEGHLSLSDSKDSFPPSFTLLQNPCIQTFQEKHLSRKLDKNTMENFRLEDELRPTSVQIKEEPVDCEYNELHQSKYTNLESSNPCTNTNCGEITDSESQRTSGISKKGNNKILLLI